MDLFVQFAIFPTAPQRVLLENRFYTYTRILALAKIASAYLPLHTYTWTPAPVYLHLLNCTCILASTHDCCEW